MVKRIECSATPLSLEEATKIGSSRYFTGISCPFGHVSERYVASGNCIECNRLRGRKKKKFPRRLSRTQILRSQSGNPHDRNIISRSDAANRGLVKYFTGKNCNNGHLSERYVSSKRCVECDTHLHKYKWPRRLKVLEKIAGRQRPDCCEVCGSTEKISFDHCHAKGHFRGWLCNGCNRALGFVRDNPALLRQLADYLEQDSACQPKITSR